MKKIKTLISFALLITTLHSVAQKKVSDLTLVYDAVISTGTSEPKLADAFDGSTTTIYLKSNLSRTEMVSALASFTTIYNGQTGNAVILEEVNGQKLLIKMNADNWKEKNKKYADIKFVDSAETKVIAGYKCKKAVAQLNDGTSFVVYYTTEILPENMDFNYQFRNLKGLPLAYEVTQGNLKISYTVSSISLNPVPAAKFDVPKSGYREMTYDESKKLGM
jgi:GLPGLI family protein